MRLLFIRHGDPDYEHDTVTEKGEREIRLLAERLAKEDMTAIYISPLGRAKKTAEATLLKTGREGKILPWLQEFVYPIIMPDSGQKHLLWDFLPAFVEKYPMLMSSENWRKVPFISQSEALKVYDETVEAFDVLLASHGYRRNGAFYSAENSNRDTLVFFCHLGITGILLSHLFNQSPVALLQHFAAPPSSVTVVYTEEREKGIVHFRCSSYGDVSHLFAGAEEPSFMGRFCETYDSDERHE